MAQQFLLASHLLDEVEKVCSHVVVIRNGIKLYSGRVDEMTSSFGVIEIETIEFNHRAFSGLKNYDGIESTSEEEWKIFLKLSKDVSSADMNKYLMQNNIVLSHLVKRLPTLEQQFLTITNNN